MVYHLAWMLSDLGVQVLAVDLDPQANLTAAFIDESDLEIMWDGAPKAPTIYGYIEPLVRGVGDIAEPVTYPAGDNLALLAGDLLLSAFEDELSAQWLSALSGNERAFRVLSAFSRLMQRAAEKNEAEIILLDLGPNLASINRAALIAADYVVVPLSPDLFSLQGLRSLGPAFKKWRGEWHDRLDRRPGADIPLPAGRIEPLGYVVQQHSVRLDRPVTAYEKWIARIPMEYRRHVLSQPAAEAVSIFDDPHKLALMRYYRSLTPMALEARKPMFHLKPADGAIGAHLQSAQDAYRDFKHLALAIKDRIPNQT